MNHDARDVMTKNVIVVDADTTINELIKVFVENKISCAPVVDDKKKIVGIVTKTDVLGFFMDMDIHVSVKEVLKEIFEYTSTHEEQEILSDTDMKVSVIMTPDPMTAEEDTTVKNMAITMIENNIHRLIITRNQEIVGIVSSLDVLYHVSGKNKNDRGK